MGAPSALTIDEGLRDLIPDLTTDELAQLEENLVRDGCREALAVWPVDGRTILLDGHHRYAICQRRQLPYRTTAVALPTRDAAVAWVLANQLGRRNLSADQMAYYRGRLLEQTQKQPGKRTDLTLSQRETRLDAIGTLAKQHRVSRATLARDAEYARAVDALDRTEPGTRARVLAGTEKRTRTAIVQASKPKPTRQPTTTPPVPERPAVQPTVPAAADSPAVRLNTELARLMDQYSERWVVLQALWVAQRRLEARGEGIVPKVLLKRCNELAQCLAEMQSKIDRAERRAADRREKAAAS